MSLRIPLTISILLIAVMAATSVWGYYAIPDGAHVAIHWGLNGRANGFATKEKALWLAPGIAAGVTILMTAIRYVEPRQQNLAASRKLYLVAWIAALGVMTLMHGAAVLNAAGVAVDMSMLALVAVSVLIAVVGNYVSKSRATFLVGGMRLPWTLTSDLAWEKSNRLLGRIFVGTSLVALASGFAWGAPVGLALLAAGIFFGVITAGITAYVVWKHDPDRQTGDTMRE